MSPTSPEAVKSLIVAFKKNLLDRKLDDMSLVAERQAIIRSWTNPYPVTPTTPPHRLPACLYLNQTITNGLAGPCRPLVAAIAPLLDALQWRYGYAPDPRWPDLAERIAFAPIIGGQGVLNDDKAHLGLTLIAPETHYPIHSHPAIETYLVLAGIADWRLEGKPFERQPPGALIWHHSGVGHAMRTGAEPLLALYIWRGDLTTAPVYVEEEGAANGLADGGRAKHGRSP